MLFLPLTLAVALRLHGQPLLRWIALTSVIFYAFAGHWWFIVPMLVTTVVDYGVAIAIERARGSRARAWLLGVSLAGNLGMLAYFKYSGLMVHTVEQGLVLLGAEDRAGFFRWFEVILPAGISFYTFQTIVLHHRRVAAARPRPSATSSGSPASCRFFPHLVAGPIIAPPPADPAAHAHRTTGIARDGATRRRCSSAWASPRRCCIADRLRQRRRPASRRRGGAAISCGAWLGVLGYALPDLLRLQRLLGHGHRPRRGCSGFELPQNFDRPYTAASSPTSGGAGTSRCRPGCATTSTSRSAATGARPRARDVNLLVTMLLGGLWHGANWTFVVWGAWHGVLLVVHQSWPGLGPAP